MDQQPLVPMETEEPQKSASLSSLFDTLEMFCWAFFLVILLFTVFFRFCRVSGSSMMKTLENGQTLLVCDLGYTPKTGDIVVFQYPGEDLEPFLIKRVIATEGQHLVINFETKVITIDGVPYADPHAHFLNRLGQEQDHYTVYAEHFFDPYTKTLELIVPEGKLFVMGDNRNHSLDSRSRQVGFVDEERVIGRVIVRLYPLSLYPQDKTEERG